ncbi:MAG: T9SS type A sorting domain-containing protein [Flavobacteriia bacterium]|jgi:hypothetical protein
MKNIYLIISFSLLFVAKFTNAQWDVYYPSLDITSCTYPTPYSALGSIRFNESVVAGNQGRLPIPAANTDYTITFTAPPNFQFNPGVGTVTCSGDITSSSITVTSTQITITYRSSEANRADEYDYIQINGIQVRGITAPTDTNPITSANQILKTASSQTINLPNTNLIGYVASLCTCTFTLRLTDTGGDGWTGNRVTVEGLNGDLLTNQTLASGAGPLNITFTTGPGDELEVYRSVLGTNPSQMRVQIINGLGVSILGPVQPLAYGSNTLVTIVGGCTITLLPIELLYFDAKLNEKQTVDLAWETASERNNDYFTIEKSMTGSDWEYLGNVDGAGTTSTPHSYYLEDLNPAFGNNYYRLKQTDFNGDFVYSNIKNVNLPFSDNIQIYPNPAKNLLSITGKDLSKTEIEIFNNLGQKIDIKKNFISIDHLEINIEHLASGLYTVRFMIGEVYQDVQKLMIHH